MNFLATAAFGLEGLVARELRALGCPADAINGGAAFHGTLEDAMRANLCLRSADRVLLVLDTFPATTFEALFEGVRAIAWEDYLTPQCAFPVSGNCARSTLMSIRDCQSITKKAIVERLKSRYPLDWFPENGPVVPISVTLHGDTARLCIDLSGTALNRRGYRTWNGEAPLRETLAASLVSLSPWRPGLPLYDPCCGTGTLLIEAAMVMGKLAPGLERPMAMESFPFVSQDMCRRLRETLRAQAEPDHIRDISGSDIDPQALTLARRHLAQAGLKGKLSLSCMDLRNVQLQAPQGVFLCNPPYGERLSDRRSCEQLYAELSRLQDRHPGWTLCAISSHPQFERCFGRRADKKRRLYNGRLECEFMTFLPRHPHPAVERPQAPRP